jgi:lipid A 3-O-deacylase
MALRKCVIGLVVLLLTTPGQFSRAQNSSEKASIGILYGFRTGLLAHDVSGLWSGSSREGGADVNVEIIFDKPDLRLGHGRILPNAGMSINTRGDTSKAYGGVIWEFTFGNGFFTNAGLGLAVHNGETSSGAPDKKQLGSRLLFRIPFEFGFTICGHHSLSILFDHVSNAYLASPNPGMDNLGVRYGYRF